MDNCETDALRAVFSGVLEEYAFLFCDPCDPGQPPGEGPFVKTSIEFDGPLAGEIALYAPASFSRELAANVLGIEEDCHEAASAAPDAVKELVNITCGNFVTAVAGIESQFHLGVPRYEPISTNLWLRALADPASTMVLVGANAVLLQLTVSRPNKPKDGPDL